MLTTSRVSNPGPRLRWSRTRYAVIPTTCLAVLGIPSLAHADLTGEFATSIDVDTEWVTGANNATDVAFSSDGRALVTRKSGEVTIRRADGTLTQVTPFPNVDDASEKGLLGVVADPTTENGFFFYVSINSEHFVRRGLLTAEDELMIDEAPIVGGDTGPTLEGPANHDGGGMFVHDGYLYVGVGDSGANSSPPTNKYSSCLNKPNGSILRVNFDGSVPDDNPLVGVSQVTTCEQTTGAWSTGAPDERIYAWGFRNPWRFWIDPVTDLMWIGDVGELAREEITVGTGNQHYGYPFVEADLDWTQGQPASALGRHCPDIEPNVGDCVPSVHAYDNPGEAFSDPAAVTGGLIPSGCGWTNAMGGRTLYFFADSSINWIHALEVNEDRSGVVSPDAIEVGSYQNGRPVSFRMGPDDAMYVVLHGSGAVYRMSPADPTGDDCEDDPMGMGGMGNGEAGAGAGGTPNGEGGTPAVGGTPNAGGGTPNVGGGPSNGNGGEPAGPGPGPQGGDGPGPAPTTPNPGGTPTTPNPNPGGTPTTPSPNPGSPAGTTPVGSAGAGGGGGLGEETDAGDEGCGCRIGVERSTGGLSSLLLALGIGGLLRRRRR